MTVTQQIFQKLSERLGNETNLSDITWALLEVIDEFRNDVWKILSGEDSKGALIETAREYRFENGKQVDFVFKTASTWLLVENKIGDRNYHFEDYTQAAREIENTEHVRVINCLLTAHTLTGKSDLDAKQAGWRVVRWAEIVDAISKRPMKEKGYEQYQEVVSGYLAYVKEVCGMKHVETMRFEPQSLHSLFYLSNLIGNLIHQGQLAGDDYNIMYYPAHTREYGECWVGNYYTITMHDVNQTLYVWLGIGYCDQDPPGIHIVLEYDWNKPARSLPKMLGEKYSDNYCRLIPESGQVKLELLPERYEKFNQMNVEEQTTELRDFALHVNRILVDKLLRRP